VKKTREIITNKMKAMKKTISFIVLLFSAQCLFAQPVLNNNLNFTIGDKYRIDGYNDVTTIDPGGPGGNQVWDFSVIVGEDFFEGEAAICVDPATTPFADSTWTAQADIATKPYASEFGPYQYYKSNPNSRELLASAMYEPGGSVFSKYLSPYTDLQFPLAYGGSFNFQTEMLMYWITMGYYVMRDSGHVTVEADAWGSITTPEGSYPNVLRLKTTSVIHSWYRYDIGEPWTYLGEFTDISYTWYTANIKVPVLTIMEFQFDKGGKGMYAVHYLADYESTTGVESPDEKTFSMYPNPAKNFIHIVSGDDFWADEIIIYDQQGKEALRKHPGNGSLDLSALKPGIYFVNLISKQTTLTRKLVIQ